MPLPGMTQDESMAYLDGRTTAAMFICAMIVATPQLKPAELIEVFTATCEQEKATAGASPEEQAYAQGYATLLPFLDRAMKTMEAANALHLPPAPATQH